MVLWPSKLFASTRRFISWLWVVRLTSCQAITDAKVVAFDDLGMEAIYAFTVKDMPVSVAVDAQGIRAHYGAETVAGQHRRASH